MATPVRVNEDNYADLQKEADAQRRSVVGQLNVLLDERYGRTTVGTPVVQLVPPKKIGSEANASGVMGLLEPVIPSPMPDAMDILASNLEQPCCTHPTRPCKHWIWDNDMGDGYKNVLSGRFREAD